ELDRTFESDANGQFTLGYGQGLVTLALSQRTNYSGFFPDTIRHTFEPGTVNDTVFVLRSFPTGSIAGNLTREDTGQPVVGFPMKISNTPLVGVSDQNGDYLFPSLLADTTYTLEATTFGYRPQSRPVQVSPGEQLVEDFTLEPDLSDAFEFDLGWMVSSTSESGTGIWERIDPEPVLFPATEVPVQPDSDSTPDGTIAYVTGGSNQLLDNVDSTTILTSPTFDVLDFLNPAITYYRWFFSNPVTEVDFLQVEVSNDGGITWVVLEKVTEKENEWKFKHFRIADYVTPTQTMHVRFVATDGDRATLVEAGIDDFAIIEALTGVASNDASLPKIYRLYQSYPNPFNPSSVIRYDMPYFSEVSLTVFNLLGQEVARLVDDRQEPGSYAVDFNAERLSSGLYFYRLEAEPELTTVGKVSDGDSNRKFIMTRKMLLIK
ncbi:MAG: carboxypeptidase regulatory-like domain-containing protein, partial [Bacteroidota bacterium]